MRESSSLACDQKLKKKNHSLQLQSSRTVLLLNKPRALLLLPFTPLPTPTHASTPTTYSYSPWQERAREPAAAPPPLLSCCTTRRCPPATTMAMVASRERRLSPPGGAAQGAPQVDAGKYVRYTPEQVEALERVYSECPKPSSLRRQQLIRDCPILSNIEPKQIKVWFQNRRSVAPSPARSVSFFLSWFCSPLASCGANTLRDLGARARREACRVEK